MDTRDLATFAAVARLGGMGRAARALNTVQSNVTQRVRRLDGSIHHHSGFRMGSMRTGTRICGATAGSSPAKPGAETPMIVIG